MYSIRILQSLQAILVSESLISSNADYEGNLSSRPTAPMGSTGLSSPFREQEVRGLPQYAAQLLIEAFAVYIISTLAVYVNGI